MLDELPRDGIELQESLLPRPSSGTQLQVHAMHKAADAAAQVGQARHQGAPPDKSRLDSRLLVLGVVSVLISACVLPYILFELGAWHCASCARSSPTIVAGVSGDLGCSIGIEGLTKSDAENYAGQLPLWLRSVIGFAVLEKVARKIAGHGGSAPSFVTLLLVGGGSTSGVAAEAGWAAIVGGSLWYVAPH